MRTPAALVLLALVVLAGCRATPGDVIVEIRNLSPEAVTFVREEPGPFLFPNVNTDLIQPWEPGVCYPRLGLYRGHIKLTVSGSNVPDPVSSETTTGVDRPEPIGIQVDPDGRVQFGVTIPDDDEPCISGGY